MDIHFYNTFVKKTDWENNFSKNKETLSSVIQESSDSDKYGKAAIDVKINKITHTYREIA